MSVNGLNWQTVPMSFSSGLSQRSDDRARPQPFLDICKDVQFDEFGGIQVRFPYAAMSRDIFGGGSLTNCRRLAVVNDELCVFTDVAMYSWNAQLTKWVLRSTHLAAAIDATPRFVTTGDQIDGDRAELSGTVVYAWTEGTQVYAAAFDKTTGSVLVSPTAVSTAVGRPRLVALATKILLFTDAGSNNLTVRAIDPATPGTAIAGAGTTVLATNYNAYYDVVKVDAQDIAVGACRRVTTTSYTVFTVTALLVVATSTKARTADGPLAVASLPGGGVSTQVLRGNGTNLQGDFLTTATLADVTTGQAVGTLSTTFENIAAAFRSVQTLGAFRCYAFWSDTGAGQCKFNYVDSAGSIGTEANFVLTTGVGSRAFDHGGSVYVWLTFANAISSGVVLGDGPAVQNTMFLYRDDALPVAKALPGITGGGAGVIPIAVPSIGRLPGAALTGTGEYTIAGAFRRKVSLGTGGTGYAARSPIDVVATFDSNEARRTARLGQTLYISGGEVAQYDGERISELGFSIFPWRFATTAIAGGSMAEGDFGYELTFRCVNAKGELERSLTSPRSTGTVTAGNTAIRVDTIAPLMTSRKQGVTVEVWRTTIDPGPESPSYLVTSQDPNDATNPNRYLPNNTSALTLAATLEDEFSDAEASALESNPENGGFLESVPPPPAKIVLATDTRMFLAAVAGDPDRVHYSRLRDVGTLASFHETLAADVPRPGGAITALAIHNETLVVFRETAIYALPGDGLNNLGQGTNYGPSRTVSEDVGAVNHESVAVTPLGTIFKSRKGWHMITPSWAIPYIGDKVSDYDSETVLAVDVVETQHHARILTASRMLVWDYLAARPESPMGQWGEWTIADGVHSVIWNGTHVYLTVNGPKQQQSTYTALTYGLDVERTWKLDDVLQGATRVRKLQAFGEYRSAHFLWWRIAYNWQRASGVPTYVDTKSWLATPTVVGGPLQVKHSPKRPICESITVRLTAVAASTLDTAGLEETTALDLEIELISGAVWDAQLTGVVPRTISIFFEFDAAATEASFDVRDNEFGQDLGLGAGFVWTAQQGNCGIRVIGNNTTAVVSYVALELAINASSSLVQVTTFDSAHVAEPNIDMSAMDFLMSQGDFPAAVPTGEALKLTSLGLEVGIEPGLFRRLPPAQQQ